MDEKKICCQKRKSTIVYPQNDWLLHSWPIIPQTQDWHQEQFPIKPIQISQPRPQFQDSARLKR